jgi:hypothetical protein
VPIGYIPCEAYSKNSPFDLQLSRQYCPVQLLGDRFAENNAGGKYEGFAFNTVMVLIGLEAAKVAF